MSRIRVVFSIGAMHGGGSERQIVSILRHLDRSRFEPYLYLIYRSGPLLSEIPPDVKVTSFEERCGPPRGPGFLMNERRIRDMAAFLKEVSADISYDRTFLMTMVAAAAAQRMEVPNISTIVTDVPGGFRLVAGRFQWAKRRILSRLYRRSSHVLANSQGSASAAEKFYGLSPGSVRVFPNGVDIARIRQEGSRPIDDPWWNSTSRRKSILRIVSAGRLEKNKGFHLLIDAVDHLRQRIPYVEFRLVILGEGPFRSQLEQQIRQTGQQHHIRLAGFRRELPAWIRTADLFVLPSLIEGMPNVLLEAMACGTAVLSTDCNSGPREILNDGEFGALCGVNSVESLTRGIRRFVDNKPLAERYAAKATQAVETQYSITAAVRRLENLFAETVGAI